jgi:hypothetical protein
MNVFGFHSVEIDTQALRAVVLVGRWPDVVSAKPSGIRSLAIELSSVDESTPVYASELAMGFDWSGTIDGAEYLVVDGALAEKPAQPSPNHVFDYTTKQWVDPRTAETQWPVVRAQRNARLSASDWTQLPDVPLATKEAWAAYRQALRDVTLQSDPFAIDWPVAPGS